MKHSKFLFFLLSIIVLFVAVEYFRPRPIDWTRTYRNDQKMPFATQALYDLLPGLFPKQPVRSVRLPFYNLWKEQQLAPRSTYLYISENCTLEDADVKALFAYLKRGNVVFLSANGFPQLLLDSLHLKIGTNHLVDFNRAYQEQAQPDEDQQAFYNRFRLDTMALNLTNPAFKQPGKGFVLERETAENHFLTTESTQKATVLGVNQHGQYNFLKFNLGAGTLYLHSAPEVFTNYYLLQQGDANYAFRALSYLPNLPILWDEYTEQGREGEKSLFRFLFTSPSLIWAYYLTLAALFLFVLFESKRRQRVIPVLEPLRNSSLEFVETVGQLYYHQADHSVIAEKKIQHWLTYVRQRFGLKTTELDEEFKELLTAKSGLERSEIDRLLGRIGQVRYFSGNLPENQLVDLSNQIEQFYQRTQ
ncbi:hypothetical protein BWI93_19355 [Siphonobacter sp. BAB-5385]|uniref:DUF4350 domain-containing protein n=1 Tax=Siphonobacter sp. BAB-5385 TaxID=1864822 RepID=UPI000B9E6F3A|nr:DUF4350 domain-containing protein [Siphonobacter sp. BAB-5385]OZI06537.1 hypothetical protein BWI93_19355 [Siphonobacter sp. BAB-5385]